ncbi:MAG: DUF4382 domain-containing protein [Desulfuromonadaceae bacterium]|nr:DUF4382 domain-containing protein [Desulfuromonadaceae bacterium]
MSMKSSKFFCLLGACLLATLAFVQLPGCGGGSSSNGTASTGTLKVGLTDKQSDGFANLFIAIKEVRVVPVGLEGAADDDSRLPVIVTYATPHSVDILTLHFQQEILGTITLSAGNYNQVRLILAPNPTGQGSEPLNYLTLKTAPTVKISLTTPSAQQSGLKVLGNFEVKPGIINAILLDFDPNTAIVARGNDAYNMKPTSIRIVQPTTTLTSFGSLSGKVVSTIRDWSSATVSVVPQGGVTSIASGTIFSNFSSNRWEAPFSSFVPGGAYRLHVLANGFAAYSSPMQTVSTGNDTSLGEIILKNP